ncbi:MAG: DNA repair protein RecO [Bacteroidales bacterium]
MVVKTQTICLKSFPYKESSSVVSLFTKDYGLRSCIIHGGRKRNATVKSSYFQPLQKIDVVMYDKGNSALCPIKECCITANLTNTYTNMVKVSLSMFIAEVLILSLKEGNPNETMFCFLGKTISYLNDCKENKDLRDFHIFFLYHLACILGFNPMNNYDEDNPFFDISTGTFVAIEDMKTLNKELSLLFYKFINTVKEDYTYCTENFQQRNSLLNILILFFEQHITNNRPIQSQKILHMLF